MGVRGLWTLLEPAGRRADARALRGRRVAVDASIWLHQFIHATTDDDAAAAPARGFFRRIARLLHHGITPVFVFDGAAPGLKRRT
ncbi:PIN domain-like protein, partial [Ostreococcus tauri]